MTVLDVVLGVAILILGAGLIAGILGGARVARLVVAEGIKITSQRFLYVALLVMVVGMLLGTLLEQGLTSQKETEWTRFNSYQLMSYGFRWGAVLGSMILVIFTSMLFAGEFDRGTVKILLTRPVTRTDVFIAKVVTSLLLAVFVYGLVVFVSYLYGSSRGDLGPVWDTQQYEMKRTAEQMDRYLHRTVLIGFFPLLASLAFGILISNLTESSGYAVAVAMLIHMVFVVVFVFLGIQRPDIFHFYLSDPFIILKRYAEGEGTLGYEPGHLVGWYKEALFVKIPLIYAAAFLASAFAVFRWKNVHA